MVYLFGKQVVVDSKRTSIAAMAAEARLVSEGARQLMWHKGQPEIQRRIVLGMNHKTALALCKWIREPEVVGKWLSNEVS